MAGVPFKLVSFYLGLPGSHQEHGKIHVFFCVFCLFIIIIIIIIMLLFLFLWGGGAVVLVIIFFLGGGPIPRFF